MMEKEKKEELPIVVSWVGSTDIQRMRKWMNYEFLRINHLKKEKNMKSSLKNQEPLLSPKKTGKMVQSEPLLMK